MADSKCTWPACPCRATGQYCTDKPQKKTKTRIKPVSEKGKIKRELKRDVQKEDFALYWQIWKEREHTDFETGLPIEGEFRLQYFHHVLEKREKALDYADYSEYRHCKWNIVLISWQTHDKAEHNLDLTPRIKSYTEKLTRLHENGQLKGVSPLKHFIP